MQNNIDINSLLIPEIGSLEDLPLINTLNTRNNRIVVSVRKHHILGRITKVKRQRDVLSRKRRMKVHLSGSPDKSTICCINLRQKPDKTFEMLNGNTRTAVMYDAEINGDKTVYVPEYFEVTIQYIANEKSTDKTYLSFDNKNATETTSQLIKGLASRDGVVFRTKLKSGAYLRALETAVKYSDLDIDPKDTETAYSIFLPVLLEMDKTGAGNLSSAGMAAAMLFYGKYLLAEQSDLLDEMIEIPERGIEFFDRMSTGDSDGGSFKAGMCPINYVIREKDKGNIENHVTEEGVRKYLVALEAYINGDKPNKFKVKRKVDVLETFWKDII